MLKALILIERIRMKRKAAAALVFLMAILMIGILVISLDGELDRDPEETIENNESDEDQYIDDEERSKGVLYEVKNAENKAYLFGSIHFGKEEMYPLHSEVENAFEESEAIAFELDLSSTNDMGKAVELINIGTYEPNTVMTDVVPNETFKETKEILEDTEPGMNMMDIESFKPWFAAMLIAENSIRETGFEPEFGIESHFHEKAEDREMDIIGLETIEEQTEPYGKLSNESQRIYLESTIEERELMDGELEKLYTSWRDNEIDEMAEERRKMLMEENKTDSMIEFQEALVKGRDAEMAEEIDKLLEDGEHDTYFITVGYLHLVGEKDILHHLEEKGYEVENVYR